ncbi:hypothetical protein Mycsm_01701 [Mycobacterium sp. JS623]|uniref:hypothetical protein n=1 Tax=Mycobacterium sp. JS623 TaxID=212767 RepID=UPI0002A54DE1|nr:hypothetical protein [Mycobacterium sp. JS623]AGB22096.1 hypothetical protein Mycsm_01701 [Mycobacterium sp. JS623]
MTTHDEQINTDTSAPAAQPASVPQDVDSAPQDVDAAPAQPEPATAAAPPPETSAVPSETSASTNVAEVPTDMALFADDDRSSLRSRWDDVQAGFVDDPKECVQKADALVADVVQQLTEGFSDARSRLEAQWARGEQASTEDLRQALKRYREFFERLLAA